MQRFTVHIRKNTLNDINPEILQLEGQTYNFIYGWIAESDEKYAGERLWLPHDINYPRNGPTWIAEGDLKKE